MTERMHPADVQQLVRVLSCGKPAELAEAAGIDPSSIYRCLAGRTIPRPETLKRLVSASGLSMRFVESLLLPTIHAARVARLPLSESFAEDLEAAVADMERELSAAYLVPITLFLSQVADPEG